MADHIWPDNPFKRKLSIREPYLSEVVVQDQNIESAGEIEGGGGRGKNSRDYIPLGAGEE
jgi:hypothetical protein